jgi:hypothetical protein
LLLGISDLHSEQAVEVAEATMNGLRSHLLAAHPTQKMTVMEMMVINLELVCSSSTQLKS